MQKKKLEKIDPNIIDTSEPEFLKELVLSLFDRIEQLSAENAELKARLNQNSQNSSRPPSSDGYRKTAKTSPKETSKPHVGQIGHKGNTQRQVSNPDHIVCCSPTKCSCGHEFMATDEKILQSKRQVFEIPQPKLVVTEYQIFKCKCSHCGKISQGESPQDVNSAVQYGNMVKAFVVLMNNEYKMPMQKNQAIV